MSRVSGNELVLSDAEKDLTRMNATIMTFDRNFEQQSPGTIITVYAR